jgi:two-component system, cell cycle sensor histidine kinase and response regulator CckA
MNPTTRAGDQPARVLIVDDERNNRRLLEMMLAQEGFRLQTAVSGEAAFAVIAADPPDLILLDVMMPGMDGYQVAARLKADRATTNIPIIMITAADDRDARMLGLSAGAEDFLTKPVDRAELCVRVRNLLRLKAYGDYYGKYSEMLEGEVASRTADLVERSKALEEHATALRRNEERTNFALAAARMGVWEVDMATQRITWSATMAPMFGLTPEKAPISAEAYFALIHPDDRRMVEDSVAQAARENIDYEVEFRVVWPDGTTHWQAGHGRMIRDASDRPVRLLGVGTDISDRKSLEAQFRQVQKMEAVGQLAGGVAHDFNNLLTAILGYSTFVIDTFDPKDRRRADMDEVIKAGQRAATLTKQLLAFSRKQVLQPTDVDLNALVTGMRQMLSRLIGEHVDLVPILAADLGVVRADSGQLEQVLMNLVVNARDAMTSGGRLTVETANVELDESFMQDVVIHPGRYVMLAVSDNGIGMSDATKQRLFEPFFTTKEPGKGTGLGLATIYGIVKQSGGYVFVFSELGKGAAFKVYLPRADGAHQLEIASDGGEATASGTETVIVVEDQDAVRFLTCRMLEKVGYRVFDAPNPEQAKALFDKNGTHFDLLVADVIMPGSSGPKLFERLSQQRPDLKVLFVSGYTHDTIVHQGQLDPGVEFLQKPFTADALSRRVREVLDR